MQLILQVFIVVAVLGCVYANEFEKFFASVNPQGNCDVDACKEYLEESVQFLMGKSTDQPTTKLHSSVAVYLNFMVSNPAKSKLIIRTPAQVCYPSLEGEEPVQLVGLQSLPLHYITPKNFEGDKVTLFETVREGMTAAAYYPMEIALGNLNVSGEKTQKPILVIHEAVSLHARTEKDAIAWYNIALIWMAEDKLNLPDKKNLVRLAELKAMSWATPGPSRMFYVVDFLLSIFEVSGRLLHKAYEVASKSKSPKPEEVV